MSVASGIKEKLQPVRAIVNIQATAAKNVLGEQMNFMRDCVTVSSRHADELRGSSDPSATLRAPLDIGLEISSNWLSTVGRQWDILAKSTSAVTGEFRAAKEETKDFAGEVKEEAKDFAAKAKVSAEEVKASAKDAVNEADAASSKSGPTVKTDSATRKS